jgi:hypothetical protein
MSDKLMRKAYDDEPRNIISRRWFLQGAVTAIGAAGFAFGQDKAAKPLLEKTLPPDGPAVAVDCGCVNDAALPLMAVATVGGKYFGYAGTESGPQIFSLHLDGERQVALEAPLKLDLPADFVFGSLGAARGGLIVSGGLPFVLETLEVDYELTEDVRAAMDNSIPEGIPTTGRKRVEITGIQPAVFMINRPNTERLLLPKMPKRSFAVATAVAETAKGGMALLIEHSDGVNESYYATAVDVIEENGSEWNIWNAGRTLGESGPNYLAADGETLAAGINTAEGSYVVNSNQRTALNTGTSNRILSLIPGHEGLTALMKDQTGQSIWSYVSQEGRLTAGASVEMPNDELVGAIAVAGAKGQVLLLGRRSTVLVENIPAFASRAKGGE